MKLLEKLGLVRKREQEKAAAELAAAKARMFELRRRDEEERVWSMEDYAKENSPRALELLHEENKTRELYGQLDADQRWLRHVFKKTEEEYAKRNAPRYLELFRLRRELNAHQLKSRS